MSDGVNVMKTSQIYRTSNLPERFDNPEIQKGYSEKKPHPIYQTSSSGYGGKKPSVHTMPNQFHGRQSKFTKPISLACNARTLINQLPRSLRELRRKSDSEQ
eukprot:sb/3478351/